MRTTLTLDDDIAALIKERALVEGASFKQIVNQVMRSGLLERHGSRSKLKTPRTQPHAFGFRNSIDFNKMNSLADELEIAEIVRGLHKV